MNQTGCPQFERENLRAKMLRFSGFRAKVFLAPSAFAQKTLCRWWPLLTCLWRNLGKSPSTPSQMVTKNHKWKTCGTVALLTHGQFSWSYFSSFHSLGLTIFKKIHITNPVSVSKVITKAWIPTTWLCPTSISTSTRSLRKPTTQALWPLNCAKGLERETKRFDLPCFFIVRSSAF